MRAPFEVLIFMIPVVCYLLLLPGPAKTQGREPRTTPPGTPRVRPASWSGPQETSSRRDIEMQGTLVSLPRGGAGAAAPVKAKYQVYQIHQY